MRKKCLLLFIIIAILFLPIIVYRKTSVPDRSPISLMEDWGKIQKSYYSEKTDFDIFAKGQNSIILKKDIDQAKDFYLLTGLSEEEALKSAIKSELEREALYQAAIKNGFLVSKDEVENYVKELQNSVETATNKEEIQAAIAQFNSSEEYWNYQITVYEKNLPIQNYVKCLENNYNEASTKPADTWSDYFQQLKDDLVKKENFQIIDS